MKPINLYKQTQNVTDSAVQLSVRALKSILLYCQDWSNKELTLAQRLESVNAGQQLCDALIVHMKNELPIREQQLLMTIFQQTSVDLFECTTNLEKSLFENEHAIIKVIDLFTKK
jgi:hypothetical protein